MGEYMLGVSCVCLLVSFASFASVAQNGRGAIKFALGVILLAALIAPLEGLVSGIGSGLSQIGSGDYKDEGNFSEYTESAFCEGIRLAVAEEFSLEEGDVSVLAIGFSVESMRAELIKIMLYGKAASSDYRAIREFVEENGLGKCEVEIAFNG